MSVDSKRVVKNTMFLYIRMLLLMVISLYTSRVILANLGVDNFGIYNVVGGVTAMFAFFSSSLTNATQRYLNYALGCGNMKEANNVFNLHLLTYTIIYLLVLVVAIPFGLWLIYHKLQIPEARLDAATWVYVVTLVSLGFTLVGIVFNGEIVAHEDMKVYSYIGIVQGLFNMLIAFAISLQVGDKLIFYAILMMLVTISAELAKALYCTKRYTECNLRLFFSRKLLKETFGFIGWNVISCLVWMLNDQGVNVLLNMFFGPAVNAARAISFQVNNAINRFSGDFMTAVRPQMMKAYAKQDFGYLFPLFYKASKFSAFLLMVFSIPVIFNIDAVLHFWLTEVPEYSSQFTILILIFAILCVLNDPIWSIMLAVGKLKKYTILGCGVLFLIFPISYLCLESGGSPLCVFYTMIGVRLIYVVICLNILHNYLPFSVGDYLIKIIGPIAGIGISSSISCFMVTLLPNIGALDFIYKGIAMFLIVLSFIWMLGTNKDEKQFVINFIAKKMKQIKKLLNTSTKSCPTHDSIGQEG